MKIYQVTGEEFGGDQTEYVYYVAGDNLLQVTQFYNKEFTERGLYFKSASEVLTVTKDLRI